MTAALTRRRALAGSALAALGMGAALVLAVATGTTPAPAISAEARALQEEAGRLSRAYRVACREADETAEDTSDVDPPEALYVLPGDARLFLARVPSESWHTRGRIWWGEPHLIEGLRGDTFRDLSGGRGERANARRDEIVAAWDRWHADISAAEDASGHTAAEARFVVACDAYAAFRLRLAEMRTADPEVLTVKAMVMVDLCHREAARLDELLTRAVDRDCGAYETALALSMARDFISLFGSSAWRSTDA